jgi:GTP-binding protein
MVVINKIDRQDCRPDEVLSQTFDLLVELGADDKTLDFPYIYTSAREGYATHDPANKGGDVRPLLDLVLEKIPGPVVRPDDPLQLMVTSLEWSRYVGRIATGRIAAGRIKSGQQIATAPRPWLKSTRSNCSTTSDELILMKHRLVTLSP